MEAMSGNPITKPEEDVKTVTKRLAVRPTRRQTRCSGCSSAVVT